MSDYKKYSIVMVGGAAAKMALSILDEKKDELAGRYSKRYLENAEKCLNGEMVSFEDIKDITGITDFPDTMVCPCGDKGVFGALWELGELLKTGLKVNLLCP